MKNVGKVTVLLTLLMLALAVGVVGAQDAPSDVQPPVVCTHAVVTLSASVFQANLNHVAPCATVVKFTDQGRWALESDDELAITKSAHYKLCKVPAGGFVKARPGCAIVVRAVAAEGTSYRFSLKQADPVPPGKK